MNTPHRARSLCCHEPNDGGKAKQNHTLSKKQGNRAVTAATRYSEGGTSTQECELDQSRKKTTRGAGEEEKQRQEAQQGEGRQHGKDRGPHKHIGAQTNRDNEPAAPKIARRHELHRATQAKKHRTDKEKEDSTNTAVERQVAQDQGKAKRQEDRKKEGRAAERTEQNKTN